MWREWQVLHARAVLQPERHMRCDGGAMPQVQARYGRQLLYAYTSVASTKPMCKVVSDRVN